MQKLDVYCRRFFDDLAYRRKAQLRLADRAERIDLLCLEVSILRFLKERTRENAFEVFYCYCEIFQPFGSGYNGNCERILTLLNAYEENAGRLAATQRDHYSHSVLVFVMGLAIYQSNAKYRRYFQQFLGDVSRTESEYKKEFLLYWGITSLFHDIGYPFELAFAQIRQYQSELQSERLVLPSVCFDGLEGFEKISKAAQEKLDFLPKDRIGDFQSLFAYLSVQVFGGNEEYLKKIIYDLPRGKKHMDHAYFSTGILFGKIDWERVPKEHARGYLYALFAIFLHNGYSWQLVGDDWFQTHVKAFGCEQDPLGWMLLFTDALQDYGRSCFGRKIRTENYSSDGRFLITDTVFAIEYQCHYDNGVRIPCEKDVSYIEWGQVFDEIEISKKQAHQKPQKARYSDRDFFVQILDAAMGLHEYYRSIYGGKPWEELTLEYKISNIEVAKLYADKMHSLRYFFSKKRYDLQEVRVLKAKEVDELAWEEHKRWLREKKEMRWTYDPKSPKKDEQRRTHPDLKLENIQDKKLQKFEAKKDNEVISILFKILTDNGYKMYRLP